MPIGKKFHPQIRLVPHSQKTATVSFSGKLISLKIVFVCYAKKAEQKINLIGF